MPIFPRLYAGVSERTMIRLEHLPRHTGEGEGHSLAAGVFQIMIFAFHQSSLMLSPSLPPPYDGGGELEEFGLRVKV
jgi:hypothetical protein